MNTGKTKYIVFLLYVFTFHQTLLWAQVKTKKAAPDNSNANTNPDYTGYYKKIESYIPDEYSPVKHIRVAVNIFTGPGTMQNTDSTRAAIKQMMLWLNGFYANVDSATYGIAGVPWIKDTKIRFDLDARLYFYEGTKLYNTSSISVLEKHIAGVDPERLNNLNIYITDGGTAQPHAISPYPNFILQGHTGTHPSSLEGNVAVYISTLFPNYVNSQTLAHELGHALDLLHTYNRACCPETCNASDPEYLYDVFGPNPPADCYEQGRFGCTITPGENTCTNNMMGGNNMLYYYFSPMQIGKLHRALAIKSPRKYVKDDVFDNREYRIKKDETWNFDIRCYSPIVVEAGATLTVTGRILMPEQGEIIIKRGGRLIVDGGTITGAGKKWEGVKIKTSTTALERLFGNNDGLLEIKNDGVIDETTNKGH
ncbi:MAG: M43 family zinc metalloprotease [Bacteroidia bacterium]